MDAKLSNFSELSNILSVKSSLRTNLMSLFTRFGLGHLLCRMSLEKQAGIPTVLLILSLCLFRIAGESIHSMYKKSYYDLLNTGHNCYYRMMRRATMDWRKLLIGMALRFLAILRKEHAEVSSDNASYIFDDTTLEKTGYGIEQISRVFDHVQGKCILGFKLLVCAFFDGKSTIPIDMSLHCEKGKKKDFGLTAKQRKNRFSKKRKKEDPNFMRFKESTDSKLQVAVEMLKRAWAHKSLRAKYVLCDSWFTCEYFISEVLKLGKGALHLVGLAKMGNTKYMTTNWGELSAKAIITKLKAKKEVKYSRRYHCHYSEIEVVLGKRSVKLFFCKRGKKEAWKVLLTTDLNLRFMRAYEIYSMRWSIEVFFSDSKRLLGLADCSSRDFSAHIAHVSLVMIRYNILASIKRTLDYDTIGGLFGDMYLGVHELTVVEKIWAIIIEVVAVVSELIGADSDELTIQIIENDKRLAALREYAQTA